MKELKSLVIVGLIILIIFLITSLSKLLFYMDSFEGVIDSVHYQDKGLPTIIIDGEEYGFPFGSKGAMKVGDSLVKESKSLKLKLYRNKKFVIEYEWGIYDKDRKQGRIP